MQWSRLEAARGVLFHEQGTIVKDWGGRLPIALVYPNTYYVGMSSLALHTLYRLLNAEPEVVCERAFCGFRRLEPDAAPISLETQQPLSSFAVLATTFSFELDYLNFCMLLRAAGIPPLSEHRDDRHPLLLAGGPAVSANPEPLADICDAFVIGEVEEILPRLLETVHARITDPRQHLLDDLAQIPGVFVPATNGSSASTVERQRVEDLDRYPTESAIFTAATEFGNRFLTEVARGCKRACRFCLARCLYGPSRERSADRLLQGAHEALGTSQRIGLVSTAVSDYSQIEQLVDGLLRMDMRISVSSLRVDPLPEVLLEALASSGTRTLTIAPEAGSERLRRSIHKGISLQDILAAAEAAQQHRFPELKLYFMIGLPGETDEDIKAIVKLVRDIRGIFRRKVLISIASFVPKAHTPFQREAMAASAELRRRLGGLRTSLRAEGVRVTAESVGWAAVQAVLARGDRRLSAVLAAVERPSLGDWGEAMHQHGLTNEDYAQPIPTDQPLPWAFIRDPVLGERAEE